MRVWLCVWRCGYVYMRGCEGYGYILYVYGEGVREGRDSGTVVCVYGEYVCGCICGEWLWEQVGRGESAGMNLWEGKGAGVREGVLVYVCGREEVHMYMCWLCILVCM